MAIIDDSYIDDVIKSAGPFNSALDKTQGVKLRELVKLLRDGLQQEIVDHAGTVGPAGPQGPKGDTGPQGPPGASGSGYILPVATPAILGGVKQGTGLTIAIDGTISATGSGTDLGWFDVKRYGAIGDGLTNDTAAILAAIADIPAAGGVLYFPIGQYLVSGSLTIDKPTVIIGCGGLGGGEVGTIVTKPSSCILMTSGTSDLFVINSNQCQIKNIGLWNTSVTTPTAGRGLLLNKSVSFRQQDVTISNFYINQEIVNGYLWNVDACVFNDAVATNLIIRDVALPDGGDANISNSWFFAGKYANTDHILWTSGGGLKVNNIKFNTTNLATNPRHCISALLTDNTVDFLCVNSSFENFNGYGIGIIPNTGVNFSEVIINGNQFTPGGNWTGLGLWNIIQMGDKVTFPTNVVIDNNVFYNLIMGTLLAGVYSGYNMFIGSAYTTIGSGNQYKTYGHEANENIAIFNTDHLNIDRQKTLYVNPAGNGMTFDPAQGINQVFNVTVAATIAFAKVYPSSFRLYLVQDATGGHTIGWDNSNTPIIFTGTRSVNLLPNGVTVITGYYDAVINKTVLTIENSIHLGTFLTAERLALTGINTGSTCYDRQVGGFFYYNGTVWIGFSTKTFTTGFTDASDVITNDALTGKAGGQTLLGDKNSGGNLTLSSTASGAKGMINLGISAAYDEANARLGIGTATPACRLDLGSDFSVSNFTFRSGSLLCQPYSLNNGLFTQNAYYNSGFRRMADGYASAIQFVNGQVLMFGIGSGSGAFSQAISFKNDFSNGGSVALGGDISGATGDYTGASLIATGTYIQAPLMAASKPLFTDAAKKLTTTGPGSAVQSIMGDGSVVSTFAINATTTALSSATLESTYPTAILGFRVICGAVTAGAVIYTKYAAGVWLATASPVQA
ncbi:Pectate lyase superfamily protein [Mucilaginibacter pineti]|uniref:Pectate lyase superfamily protein n=1 Tax=Mucilaginibacter pineti TaxID=1391627 RepID=A0A1G7ETV6_9SPHI|nr:glycosyl hydrolase family 28-related protein [Mucilaginibacter pineti]SDE67114.1 Pectate lyase superfamily protein [Mucilaginibacter pineti]